MFEFQIVTASVNVVKTAVVQTHRRGGGLVAETWTMGREGLWFVSTERQQKTNLDRSVQKSKSLPTLSSAPEQGTLLLQHLLPERCTWSLTALCVLHQMGQMQRINLPTIA